MALVTYGVHFFSHELTSGDVGVAELFHELLALGDLSDSGTA